MRHFSLDNHFYGGTFLSACFFVCLLIFPDKIFAQKTHTKYLNVGVASRNITPEYPVRLAGFALREKQEAPGTAQELKAKALAFGNNYQNTSIIITADLIGLSSKITDSVKQKLKQWVNPDNITICVSHTHSGPEIGTLLNILYYTSATTPFSDTLLPAEQIIKINLYAEQLVDHFVQVAKEALLQRKPSLVYYGLGKVDFAFNRRKKTELIDHDMPLMKITDLKGNVKAVFLSYACHAVCLGSDFNEYHGDWVGDAQLEIEKKYPEAIAMVSIGCAGDQNPQPLQPGSSINPVLQKLENSKKYGKMIAEETDKIMKQSLLPITSLPQINYKKIYLPFERIPDVKEFAARTNDISVKGFYARLALERLARGEKIAQSIPYPVSVWNFGDKLNMVFLAGEVVVEYSLRLKKELKNNPWIIAYANDVPCYIGSKRIIRQGMYEGESSMYYYNKPAKLAESVEEQIIGTVHSLMKKSKK